MPPKKILLVDRAEITDVLQDMLQLASSERLEFIKTESIEEAFTLLHEHKFDAMFFEPLIDSPVRAAGEAGLEFLGRLKAESLLSSLWVGIFTTRAFDFLSRITARAKSIIGDNCEVFPKPCDAYLLIKGFSQALELQ